MVKENRAGAPRRGAARTPRGAEGPFAAMGGGDTQRSPPGTRGDSPEGTLLPYELCSSSSGLWPWGAAGRGVTSPPGSGCQDPPPQSLSPWVFSACSLCPQPPAAPGVPPFCLVPPRGWRPDGEHGSQGTALRPPPAPVPAQQLLQPRPQQPRAICPGPGPSPLLPPSSCCPPGAQDLVFPESTGEKAPLPVRLAGCGVQGDLVPVPLGTRGASPGDTESEGLRGSASPHVPRAQTCPRGPCPPRLMSPW